MKITEARLKELITEEVNAYLEEGWKKNLAALGIGAGMALGAGEIQKGVDAQNQEISDRIAANVADAEEYNASREGILDQLNKESKKVSKFMWDWGQQSEEYDPGAGTKPWPILLDKNHGTVGVLPPEFGVFLQVMEDFESNETPRYASDNITPASGDYKQNLKNFPDQVGLTRVPDWEAKPDARPEGVVEDVVHRGWGRRPSMGGVNELIYLPADKIPEEYTMPISGMSKSEYYNQVWNKYVEEPRKE
tara:strand:+ start:94 stop:840 length:747 start_codon:yes stop_codon:yes gene_type:complete